MIKTLLNLKNIVKNNVRFIISNYQDIAIKHNLMDFIFPHLIQKKL